MRIPTAYAGKCNLLQEVKKRDSNISIEGVEEWLKSVEECGRVVTLHKLGRLNFKMRPLAVNQIDKQ